MLPGRSNLGRLSRFRRPHHTVQIPDDQRPKERNITGEDPFVRDAPDRGHRGQGRGRAGDQECQRRRRVHTLRQQAAYHRQGRQVACIDRYADQCRQKDGDKPVWPAAPD
nr:hypothetical protein [Marispirochaeta sp.]